MSKPIFIVRLPGYWNPKQFDISRKAIYDRKELSNEYHVLVLSDNEVETIRFECYNSPHEPEKLEEITKLTQISIERCLRNEEENRLRELEDE
ncbi:hypothetical protein N8985_07985 [Glaciecola sp.]|jgi:hypothetical protein|nr:hypothetical protein [Glaciecola sp.]